MFLFSFQSRNYFQKIYFINFCCYSRNVGVTWNANNHKHLRFKPIAIMELLLRHILCRIQQYEISSDNVYNPMGSNANHKSKKLTSCWYEVKLKLISFIDGLVPCLVFVLFYILLLKLKITIIFHVNPLCVYEKRKISIKSLGA